MDTNGPNNCSAYSTGSIKAKPRKLAKAVDVVCDILVSGRFCDASFCIFVLRNEP